MCSSRDLIMAKIPGPKERERERERKREVFCLLLCWKSLPGASETSLLAGHSSFLFPQIISSHAPVLWSLWGLPWLSHPCKSRGQPQPPVLGNICPQNEGFTQALFSCLALLQSSKGLRVAERLFLGALIGDHSRFASTYLMLSNDHALSAKMQTSYRIVILGINKSEVRVSTACFVLLCASAGDD